MDIKALAISGSDQGMVTYIKCFSVKLHGPELSSAPGTSKKIDRLKILGV